MSIRRLLAVAAAAPLAILWLATPAAAHVLVQPDPVGSYTLTSGRLWSLVAAGLGLAGVVAGGLALARARRRIGNGGRRGAVVALVTGLAGAVIGGMVVAAAKGGPGTGYGIVGGYMALVIGLVALTLAALTLARSRRGTA
ncbi:DUF6223 family protein [Sphaerisporangium sp. B11E5]|uniref:DUF6223 family protein n=1 Tax=Sphaerisporangium sp. B11E5 TaxID=3153563 RepID=UPI00325E0257